MSVRTADARRPAEAADSTADARRPGEAADSTADARRPAEAADSTADARRPAEAADSTADTVLAEVADRGLTLTVSDGDLRLQGPRERIDTDLVGRIRACKPMLLAALDLSRTSRPDGAVDLTPLQRAYLVARGDGSDPGSASAVLHEIEGCWDVDRLEAALGAVVARHDALRTRFGGLDEGTPWQLTEDAVDVRITRHDLAGLPADEQRERREALRAELADRVPPLDRAPLVAADVVVLGPDRMLLHVAHDGLVVDGISMFLLFRDWHAAYVSADTGSAPSGPSPAEYVATLQAAAGRAPARRSRAYWDEHLHGLPPAPELPQAAVAAPERTVFVPRAVRLAPDAWSALRDRAAACGSTPSAALLAAWADVLATWGAGREFSLVATVATRPPFHPGMAQAVGQFSDTVLLGLAADRRTPFADRARDTATRLRTTLDHRHVPGPDLLRERGRRDPAAARMPYTFNSAIDHGIPGADGSACDLFGRETWTVSRTPQVRLNVFAMEQHGGLVVQVDAVDAAFPPGLVDDVVHAYQSLLDRLATGPEWTDGPADLLPPAQRARRTAANDTAAPIVPERVHTGILRRAAADPAAPAVITSERAVSYGELLARAEAAAAWLQGHGVGRDDLVGIVMTRGPEVVVGVLAAHLAGAAYLPVDATQPAARRTGLLTDGGARCVLTNAPDACRDGDLPPGTAVLALDASGPVPAPPPDGPVRTPGDPDDLAYVLYTSGTTGTPKGVMISHRSVVNVVDDCNRRFGVGPGDRFFGISAFTFDLSVYDMSGALRAGAAVVLPDHDRAADPSHWAELCAAHGVTVWNSVPAIIGALMGEADPQALAALRLVMASGDRVPGDLPGAVRAVAPDARFVALGGPTETTIWNIAHPIEPRRSSGDPSARPDTEPAVGAVPYGRPNANNRAYVVDADGFDAPDRVEGEIWAAGVGLARGYRGDPERTADRFLDDPRRGERIYRTGDLGYWLPTGEIVISGRLDHQIKVNGYRVEPGEVEVRLVATGLVGAAAVVRDRGRGGDRLVAHVAPLAPEGTDDELRAALRREVPEYMVPSVFVWHDALPLTRNGKVDRSALQETGDTGARPSDPGGPPSTPTEHGVTEIWTELVGREAIRTRETLPELGVDSLTAARILSAVRRRFGVTIALDRIVEVDTVERMAARVDELVAAKEET